MRIVNKRTFLELPEGTLFYKLDENLSKKTDLLIKEESWDDDFRYYVLTDIEDDIDVLYDIKKNDVSTVLDISMYRDGLFNNTELYVVYEKHDIIKIIAFLTEVFNTGYGIFEKLEK